MSTTGRDKDAEKEEEERRAKKVGKKEGQGVRRRGNDGVAKMERRSEGWYWRGVVVDA